MPPSKAMTINCVGRDFEERFWSKVDKGEVDECWNWTACKDPKGYGQFKLAGKMVIAHRVAFALANDEDFPITGAGHESVLDHTCRTRACCNPAHLELTTNRENVSRGRLSDMNGSGLPRGVSFNKHTNAFGAQICLPKSPKSIYLGLFDDPKIAGTIYALALRGIERGIFKTKEDLSLVRDHAKRWRYTTKRPSF